MDGHPWFLMLPSQRLRIRYKLQGTSNVSTGSNRRPSHRGTHNNGCAAQTYTGTQMFKLLHLSFPVWILNPIAHFFLHKLLQTNLQHAIHDCKSVSRETHLTQHLTQHSLTQKSRANKNEMGIRRKRRRWSWSDDDAEELEYRVSSTREGHGQVSCASQQLQGSHWGLPEHLTETEYAETPLYVFVSSLSRSLSLGVFLGFSVSMSEYVCLCVWVCVCVWVSLCFTVSWFLCSMSERGRW